MSVMCELLLVQPLTLVPPLSDYRALKKRIAAIRKAQAGNMATSKSPLASTGLPLYYERSLSEHSEEAELPRPPAIQLRFRDAGISFLSFNNSVSTFQEVDGYLCGESPQPPEPTKCADSLFPHDDGLLSSLSHPVVIADHMSPFNINRPLSPVSTHLPLHELLPLLPTEETLFFNDLDTELLKVEKFYRDREREMVERNEELLVQLDELYEHKYVHVCVYFVYIKPVLTGSCVNTRRRSINRPQLLTPGGPQL